VASPRDEANVFCALDSVFRSIDSVGTELREVVPAGVLQRPSGIELRGDALFVTEDATSRFHAFDLEGTELASLDTTLPPGSLAGFDFGPDGNIYFVDMIGQRLLRIEPRP
jgi:sugar lactone lactonase YvrE